MAVRLPDTTKGSEANCGEPVEERQLRKIVTLPIALLLPGDSPRSGNCDQEHVARLADLDAPVPPILVDRRTMRVVDGMHRLLAAVVQGRGEIECEFFEGTAADAFLRAVEANSAHGLPLSQADRRAAAARIVLTHPHMSDRAIARATGLGAKSVAAIRRQAAPDLPHLTTRLGRDGKVRPLDGAEGRRRAAEVLAENPDASLREVARRAGISPATASDVRKRLQAGQEPVVAPRVAGEPRATSAAATRTVELPKREPGMFLVDSAGTSILEKLVRDPSLRHREEGRNLLRLLQRNAIEPREWSELVAIVPPHCGELVAGLARQYAETWLGFALEVANRAQSLADEPVAG